MFPSPDDVVWITLEVTGPTGEPSVFLCPTDQAVHGRILVPVNQHRPPAGWYDDPSGSGGRRYWNGDAWTDREAAEGAEDDRLPDGFMMLNGRRVPLGQMTTPAPARSQRRGLFVASAIALGLVLLLALVSVGPDAELDLGDWGGDDDGSYAALPESTYTLEVGSEGDEPLDVGWYDGTTWNEESGADGAWTLEVEVVDGAPVELLAMATDLQDVVTCRIVGPDGDVVAEEVSELPGSSALCRVAQSSTSPRS